MIELIFLGGAVFIGVFLLFYLAKQTKYRTITETKNEAIKHYEGFRDEIVRKQISKKKKPEPVEDEEDDEDYEVSSGGLGIGAIMSTVIVFGIMLSVGWVVFNSIKEQIMSDPTISEQLPAGTMETFNNTFQLAGVGLVVIVAMGILGVIMKFSSNN